MKGYYLKGIMLVVLMFIIVGCGSSSEDEKSATSSENSTEAKMDMDTEYEDSDGGLISDAKGPSSTVKDVDYMKYIMTYYYDLETLEFEESEQRLTELVTNYDGYFEQANVTGRSISGKMNSRRRGYFIARIPVENVDLFLSGLDGVGNELSRNSETDNVTNQYYDMEARIKTLTIREENLLEMLEDANDLEFMIQLERELSDVRYEIESYMSSFRNLENKISFTTINIDLTEVIEETVIEEERVTFMDRISGGFSDSISMVTNFFEELIIFLITKSPILILWGFIGVIAYQIVKRVRKKRQD